MITLLITSFLAGILTVLTPCSLPLLPIVLGGSVNNKSRLRPLIIIFSLAISVFTFTFILKTGINALVVDDTAIRIISGLILLILGIFTIYPNIWEKISEKTKLNIYSNNLLSTSNKYKGIPSAVLTGLALGPVFSSCSPTYGYILFAILPLNTINGVVLIISFLIGMSMFLLLISLLGQKLINKTKWAVNPNGNFKKVIGALFVLMGLLIIFKIDKNIESFLLEQQFIQNILFNKVEQNIINNL